MSVKAGNKCFVSRVKVAEKSESQQYCDKVLGLCVCVGGGVNGAAVWSLLKGASEVH